MKKSPTPSKSALLRTAIKAAEAAGQLMAKNLRLTKRANSSTQHDIKLELDVRCQKLIEKTLRQDFPDVAVLGEEGILGDPNAMSRWVVDPIDGTVNFAYGIPHSCVSIAYQVRLKKPIRGEDYETLIGVVFDPFTREMFTAIQGQKALLNGKPIKASTRSNLDEAIVALGFSKSELVLNEMLPGFNQLIYKIRKVRVLGSAALSLAYVAAGRMDAYVERGVRLWDIAAGGLILECAGGEFYRQPIGPDYQYRMTANNGKLRRKIEKFI